MALAGISSLAKTRGFYVVPVLNQSLYFLFDVESNVFSSYIVSLVFFFF